jgi:putative phosphoesterase
MRIGVISDTHMVHLPDEAITKLKAYRFDLIVHCGDYTGLDVVQQLKAMGNFCGVAGNMDSAIIWRLLNEKEIIEAEGKRIGIFHGHGLFIADQALEKVFQGEKIDIYFHGHTHQLRYEKKDNIYYLNPGSFNRSMLIVNLEAEKDIEIEKIRFLI